MSSAINIASGTSPGLLDRERIVAATGFNRWLVPPAALAIHLCIGMAYGFSVFWLPLSRAVGIAKPVVCEGATFWSALATTACDWRVVDLQWTYSLFFVVLGSAAALWGGWLERAGPRRAGVVAAFCWCGGMGIFALGIAVHQLWLMLAGAAIGGVGLGLGYISPVSTLIKWFPDRRGMATGMAIMGFGGGAIIGGPLANLLIGRFAGPADVGVWPTVLVMAAVYFVFMLGGAFGYRVPPANWQPDGWTPPPTQTKAMIAHGHVHLRDAHRTPQFWLLWAVLCLNVSATIGVIAVASPIIQEIFSGSLIGHPEVSFTQLDPDQKKLVATIGAAFVGLISLFNIGGRFVWASLSDRIGRKTTYMCFFAIGALLYALMPWAAHSGGRAIFLAFFCVIASMYGGGFATIPAYLADLFGTQFVGAIHGRLLTAWSTAGVVGPLLFASVRDQQITAGVPRDYVYDQALYIAAGFLAAGFVANLLVRPVADRWFMTPQQLAEAQAAKVGGPHAGSHGIGRGGLTVTAALAWLCVGVPLAWGIWMTLLKIIPLFG